MRKLYVFILLFVFGVSIEAQNSTPPITATVGQNYPTIISKKISDKTINCVDSVRYPQSKLSGIPETGTLTNNTALQTGISQAYHLNTTATIYGIGAYLLLDFDGIPNNRTPVIARIKVYNIDGQNYPTSPIDSSTVQVIDAGFNEQVLIFSNPIVVSDSFAIALEMGTYNAVSDTIYYTTNICNWNGAICLTGDGNNEDLSCVLSPDFISANNSHWFNNNIEVFGWNIDFLIHPIIAQSFTASFLTDKDTVSVNDTVTFTNTSIHNTVPMFNNYDSITKPLYKWDFNDGLGPYNPFDTIYSFSSVGTYNTKLTTNYYGYSLNCIDSAFKPIIVRFPLSIDDEIKIVNRVNIYPIPANKHFFVEVPVKYMEGKIIISDVVGKVIQSIDILSQKKVKVNTSEITSGVYFVSIDNNDERVFTKRIVIDR